MKHTVRLLEVASGQDKLWLEHPTDSINYATTFGLIELAGKFMRVLAF